MTLTADSRERVIVDLAMRDGRYDRQELITWWDQQRLRSARVLVVGAGALGNELLKNLALLGVGTVIVADLDHVENSNLSRCVLFRESDEGKPKAVVAARAAQRLNRDVRVIPVVGDVRRTLGLGVYDSVDVVLGGLDNREVRLHVNQACWKASTPWIDGAIEGLMGIMRAFVPPASACYECTLSARDYELLTARKACSLLSRDEMLTGKVPTVATTGSVIAAMQAQEAVKLLHAGPEYEFGGRGFVFNGHTHDSYTVTYNRRDECLSHDTYALHDAPRAAPDTAFGDLLDEHGGGRAVIELESELVTAFECARCARATPVHRSMWTLTTHEALCPRCGSERRVDATHRVDSTTPELLELSPADVALPSCDVVTVRRGYERQPIVIREEGDPLELLARAV